MSGYLLKRKMIKFLAKKGPSNDFRLKNELRYKLSSAAHVIFSSKETNLKKMLKTFLVDHNRIFQLKLKIKLFLERMKII